MSALVAAQLPHLDDGTRVTFDLEQATDRRSAVNLALLALDPSDQTVSP